ncbi:MAG TPA: protein kinase [Polyangia bacterium]
MSDGAQGTPALEATILSTELPAAKLPGTGEGASDPLVGGRLRHFQVERLLGRGGMGAVYLGVDTSLERPVALKVLSPEIGHDPEVVARFEREARAQARLRHPNVAQIYFIGEERGLHFFALEFLEGPALDEVLAQRRLPWTEALEYTIAAARGLRAALAHGFIHRDVKPSNLVLDRESGIKILDFGLVKSLNGDAELTRNGAIIGSPLYMAPEQGRGEDVDHRADIYSLGCALYHMLTGKPPFSGPSPVGVIAMHMSDRAEPVRSLAPEVPERLARVVERMMAKLPADRYAGYDELVNALEASRPGQREISGFKTRAVALAIDLAPFLLLWALLGPWVAAALPVYFITCHRLTGQTLGKRLLRLAVTDRSGNRLSWKTSFLRFLAFAWGPLAMMSLVGLLFFVHRRDRVSFELGSLTSQQLAEPLLYLGLNAVIFVAYLAGFLIAAFHPKKLALHDLVCRTEVRYKSAEVNGRVARFLKATTRFRFVK